MIRQLIRLALVLSCLAAPVAAQTSDAFLAQAKADCASIDNGSFVAPPAAVQQIDLTGDGQPETLVDSGQFQCSTSASYWGGTGGNWLAVFVAGQQQDFLAQAWQVVPWDGLPVLMLWHNGADCGGAGADPCVQALIWSDYQQRFMTVAPPAE